MSYNAQESSSQVTLKAFEQQLKFICDLQQHTLEDVSMIQSQAADVLNQSIIEMGHFHSDLFTAEVGTAGQGENESNENIYTEDKVKMSDNDEEEDCVAKHTSVECSLDSLEITSEQLGTLEAIEPSSDSDLYLPVNADKQQNYNLRYNNTEQFNVSFEGEGVNIQDFKKQASYTQDMNGTEEELESSDISDSTFNVNEGGPLNSTMITFGNTAKDLIPPCDYTHISLEGKESKPTLEETEENTNTSDKDSLDKLFKSMNEQIAWLKHFLCDTDLVKISDPLDSKPLQKALRQLHINAQILGSENLQCREQINQLRTEKTFLRIQLSIAEQDAEAYHQQAKAMTYRCEELLKQREQSQDERNHLGCQRELMMKQIELLKDENKTFFKEISEAIIKKKELIKKLDSTKKMALSYAREKQELHRKWNETLMENYQLRRKADEWRTQNLKSNDIICTGSSSDSDQTSLVNNDTLQNYDLQNTDNCKLETSNVLFKSEEVNHQDFIKQASNTKHSNETEEVELESLGISNSTFNVNESLPLSSTRKMVTFKDKAKDDTLYITDLIPPCDYTRISPECKEYETTLEEIEYNKNTYEMKNLDKLFKSMSEDLATWKRFLREADWVKISEPLENKPLQKALRQLHINAQVLSSENLQCREQINRLRTEKTFLRIQLSIAEQDAEAYHQQAKAMTYRCEELVKQKEQVQSERNQLSFQIDLLMKQIELLKEEKEMYLKDQSMAIIEKEEVIKKLEASKKMALSYARETEEIHRKWNETLMENYELRRKADEWGTQNLKHGTFKWSIKAFYT